MKKPYAISTLRTKYKQTCIPQAKIDTVVIYLTACANFYKLIALEDAWRVIGKQCEKESGVSRADFDALVPIFTRDGRLTFYIRSETELYVDGKEKLLLIDKDYLLSGNDAFSDMDREELLRCEECNEPYDGPLPLEEDWERFYELSQHQQGKALYIVADIIRYADPLYVEETVQVKAMRRFLMSEVALEIPPEIQEEAKTWSATKKKSELKALREAVVNATILDMHNAICDASVPQSEIIPAVLELMEEVGYQLDRCERIDRLVELFTEMSNHTRMPSNRGFTPMEMMWKMDGLPKQVRLGAGMLQLIQSGEIDGGALKKSIVEEGGIPLEMRASLLREIDQAMMNAGKRKKNN